MVPEIGQIFLALALALALVQGILPLIGAQFGINSWIAIATFNELKSESVGI